jgi:hypothetical protein
MTGLFLQTKELSSVDMPCTQARHGTLHRSFRKPGSNAASRTDQGFVPKQLNIKRNFMVPEMCRNTCSQGKHEISSLDIDLHTSNAPLGLLVGCLALP